MKRHQQNSISSYFSKVPKFDVEKSTFKPVVELSEVDRDEENEENETADERNTTSHAPDDDDIASYQQSNLNDNEQIDALNKIKNHSLSSFNNLMFSSNRLISEKVHKNLEHLFHFYQGDLNGSLQMFFGKIEM